MITSVALHTVLWWIVLRFVAGALRDKEQVSVHIFLGGRLIKQEQALSGILSSWAAGDGVRGCWEHRPTCREGICHCCGCWHCYGQVCLSHVLKHRQVGSLTCSQTFSCMPTFCPARPMQWASESLGTAVVHHQGLCSVAPAPPSAASIPVHGGCMPVSLL